MSKIDVTWSDFKAIALDKARIRYLDRGGFYLIWCADGAGTFETSVEKDNGADHVDFDTNYKSAANKSATDTVQIQSQPSYGAKSFLASGVTKKLYARNTGWQTSLVAGSNTINHTIAYPWVKLVGIEVVNCEALDIVNFKVRDNNAGTYSGTGVPNYLLNQFGFTVNMPKDFFNRESPFDADLYSGMVVEITYTSLSAKTVGFNLIMNEVKS